MKNSKYIIAAVAVVGFVFIYHNTNTVSSVERAPAAVEKKSTKSLVVENSIAVKNSLPAQLPTGKIYDLDFSKVDKSEFNAEQIKEKLIEQGWHNVFVQKDPKYGFRVHVEGEQVNPEIVLATMKDNWEKNQGEILNNLNGRQIELTEQDKAAISELRAQMPNL